MTYTNNDLERRKKEKQRKLEERREERGRRADKGVAVRKNSIILSNFPPLQY